MLISPPPTQASRPRVSRKTARPRGTIGTVEEPMERIP